MCTHEKRLKHEIFIFFCKLGLILFEIERTEEITIIFFSRMISTSFCVLILDIKMSCMKI
jgi:hypothetical protein